MLCDTGPRLHVVFCLVKCLCCVELHGKVQCLTELVLTSVNLIFSYFYLLGRNVNFCAHFFCGTTFFLFNLILNAVMVFCLITFCIFTFLVCVQYTPNCTLSAFTA